MSKAGRLSRSDFKAGLGPEARYHGRLFSLSTHHIARGRTTSFSCIVSKKVASKAVQRNRIKRFCREAVSLHMKGMVSNHPLALIFRAKKEASSAAFADCVRDIGGLIDKVSDMRYTRL